MRRLPQSDRGIAINSTRIVDIVNAALDAGRLRLPFAAAPITIADGRAQLADLAAPAQSADVTASAALTLADNQVDMRIALTGPQRSNAPAGERPSLAVAVKGPLAAARRTADVTALVGWLTSRAVEQETKRLNDAERERKRLEPTEPRRRQDAAVPAEPESAVAATMGRAPDLPAPIEIKPRPPAARRPRLRLHRRRDWRPGRSNGSCKAIIEEAAAGVRVFRFDSSSDHRVMPAKRASRADYRWTC